MKKFASKIWDFEAEDGKHIITLEHTWDSRRVITLDNKIVIDKTPVNNWGFEYSFDCGSHTCIVRCRANFFSFLSRWTYSCSVDGNDIQERSNN